MTITHNIPTYLGEWKSWADVSGSFEGTSWRCDDDVPAAAVPEPEEVILAAYIDEDYSGSAFILYRNGDRYYTVTCSHCSCYGLEGQWKPEEYALPVLVEALRKSGYITTVFEQNRDAIIGELERRVAAA